MNNSENKNTPQLPGKRILVIRYRFLGDTILTVPFLRNLRYAYPDAKIDMMVGPVSGEVLKGCPYVDEFIVFDTTRFHKYDKGKGRSRSFFSYVKEIRAKKYDLVFVLKRSMSSAILAFLSGAKYRVGYATEGRSLLLTHRFPFDQSIHEIDSVLMALTSAGIPIRDKHLDAWISDEEKASIEKKVPELQKTNPKVLIHVAAAHPDKIYPLESWVSIIKELKQKWNITPFFTGAKEDRAVYSELEALTEVKSVNMAGELNIRESMSLYKEMDLAICVDSGPAHLAAAVGVPTYTIFGPTDPDRWAPFGNNCSAIFDSSLECRPCHYQKTCNNRECLTELSPSKVINAVQKAFKVGEQK